ncbi:MAG: hypothetical protein HDQ44_03185 [Desulfovibrio sp.]|nr:hypothetical protein [Desulfovibrio sp.]
MAFEALTPLSAIWRRAGLRYVLVPEELRLKQRPAARPVDRPEPVNGRPGRPAAPRPAQLQTPQEPLERAPVTQPLPELRDWPPVWAAQLARSRKGRVAWTYWDLGADLIAATEQGAPKNDARARRGALLRKLMASLGHKPGTHTLWPVRMGEQAEPQLFWAGFLELGCRYVFVFGEQASLALTGKPGLAAYRQLRERGRIIWTLPDIDAFDDVVYKRVIAFIQSSLAPLSID